MAAVTAQETARYTFRVEWFDQLAALKRYYLLFYAVRMDGMDEIELVGAVAARARCAQRSLSAMLCCIA